MYRRTDPPPPPPPQKAEAKAKSRKSKSTRSSKRRKQSTPEEEDPAEDEETAENEKHKESEDEGLGGMKWECVCVTLEDYQEYMGSIRRSKHIDEKELYERIEDEIIPELGKVAEEQARKEARKLKELETLQKLANAKRSSRISARVEKQKEVEQAEEEERKRRTELSIAKAEQEKQRKMEEVRIPGPIIVRTPLMHHRPMNPADKRESNEFASAKLRRYFKRRTFVNLRRMKRSWRQSRPDYRKEISRRR